MQRVLASLWLVLLPLTALADGKVFSQAVLATNINIPDQRALIHFSNGVERLVIETRFTGAGTNFAWVVPLPSQPVIEEASTGLFPTLEYLFRPRIEHAVPRYYLAVFAFLGLAYLLLFVRHERPLTWLDGVACLLVGTAIGTANPPAGFAAALLLFASILIVRMFENFAIAVLLLILVFGLLAALLTPSLGRSRASAGPSAAADQDVSILERRLVGVFETTTIASKDPRALGVWLRDNGFATSTNSEPVIESYVKEGWIFVAAKLQREPRRSGPETSTPHPLSFTFPTSTPIYPMRLTGVDNSPVSVELYMFGPGRARAWPFKTVQCTRPAFPTPPGSWSHRKPEGLQVVHPLLRKWVLGSPVATRLAATLTPEVMRRDVKLEWAPFAEKKARLFSHAGARTSALNWGSALLALGLALSCMIAVRGKRLAVSTPWLVWGIAGVAILAGCAVYFSLSKVEIQLVRHPGASTQYELYQLGWLLGDATNATPAGLRAEARAILGEPIKEIRTTWENLLLGGQIHEEDSPGNYMIRQAEGRVEYVVYDAQGAAHVQASLPAHSGP